MLDLNKKGGKKFKVILAIVVVVLVAALVLGPIIAAIVNSVR